MRYAYRSSVHCSFDFCQVRVSSLPVSCKLFTFIIFMLILNKSGLLSGYKDDLGMLFFLVGSDLAADGRSEPATSPIGASVVNVHTFSDRPGEDSSKVGERSRGILRSARQLSSFLAARCHQEA